ncbi:DUF2559 family protein, partial [Salmonella enterica subsp. enterica]|nr:DUF2559 family protein [Salmonella enterica]EDW4265447.1 DUF2559 family protein [Salmonella enterica subsp. enterica serovar Sinstorf]
EALARLDELRRHYER